jgi:hypothetical protein
MHPALPQVAVHLDEALESSLGIAAARASPSLASQLVIAAAMLLQEGLLEARVRGKRLLFHLRAALPAEQLASVVATLPKHVQQRVRTACTVHALGQQASACRCF